ncbi:hypothetical protein DFP72DRAFT_345709 [Ephemerocybe angulata]|uniref:Uncharacterized protein n=1 Tax=Ephemerocybe angulata TaxID=980116 RepID=A0A8H6LSF9_9AGAR|nr:hypothetical protein DFP72DRAFT_345709 [Tulosesus angulatus]
MVHSKKRGVHGRQRHWGEWAPSVRNRSRQPPTCDHQSKVSQDSKIRPMNGRSYYKWILSLVANVDKGVDITYTKGHSLETTLEAIPHFFMDGYMLFSSRDGWIESNIPSYIDARLVELSAAALSIGHKQRMMTKPYDLTTPPQPPYIRSTSAFSATVQLYARSGQFPTKNIVFECGSSFDAWCPFGCEHTGDPHHLFAECKVYDEWREETRNILVTRTRTIVEGSDLDGYEYRKGLIEGYEAAELFLNVTSPIWPFQFTQFYLGLVPPLDRWINVQTLPGEVARRRLKTAIANEWHLHSIRLAGRIWGDYKRRGCFA